MLVEVDKFMSLMPGLENVQFSMLNVQPAGFAQFALRIEY
jgi:hypothetical protein